MNYLAEWKIFLYNKQIKQHDFDVTYRNNNVKNKLLHSTLYSFFTFSFKPFHIFTYISRCSYSYQTFTRITHKDVCKRRIENFCHRRIWISSNKIKLLRQFFYVQRSVCSGIWYINCNKRWSLETKTQRSHKCNTKNS